MLPEIAGTVIPNPMWSGFSFDRVLDYYDGPRLLLQRSLAGQLFLAWWERLGLIYRQVDISTYQ